MENRPNCLVLDEIDGATKAAINVLIAMLKSASAAGKSTDEDDSTTAKKKSKKNALLRRPIICICNDIHAPALRALRKIGVSPPPQYSHGRHLFGYSPACLVMNHAALFWSVLCTQETALVALCG